MIILELTKFFPIATCPSCEICGEQKIQAFLTKYFGFLSVLFHHYPSYYLIYHQHYIILAMDSIV